MIPLSGRHARLLAVLLLLAAVPIAVNVYGGRRHDDCADPAALRALPPLLGGTSWEQQSDPRGDGVFQWSEAQADVNDEGVDPLRFRIVRSFDPLALALLPAAFVGAQNDSYTHELAQLDTGGDTVPVHVRRAESLGLARAMLYLFVVDGRPVEDPVRASLAGTLTRVLRGPRPATLYWASGSTRPSRVAREGRRARDWIAESWRRHQRACAS